MADSGPSKIVEIISKIRMSVVFEFVSWLVVRSVQRNYRQLIDTCTFHKYTQQNGITNTSIHPFKNCDLEIKVAM